nr:unnamed protein product [Spirometra erinaceieuropaei]
MREAELNLLIGVLENPKLVYSYTRQSMRNKDPTALLWTAEGENLTEDTKANQASEFLKSLLARRVGFKSHESDFLEATIIETIQCTETIILKKLLELMEPGPVRVPEKALKELAEELAKSPSKLFLTSTKVE